LRAGCAASSARSDLGFAARFALGSLATWRLTHLLAEEDGPADLVLKARARLGRSRAGELMDCVYCLSIWIAAPISVGVTRRQSELPFTWLGLSAATCLIERLTNSPIAGAPGREGEGDIWDGSKAVDHGRAQRHPNQLPDRGPGR
jgi:hypothetical protein